MPNPLRWLLVYALLLPALAYGDGPSLPALVGLRIVSTDASGFWLEIANVSAKPMDYVVRLQVTLSRLDDSRGPEYAKTIWSNIDPQSGLNPESSRLGQQPHLVLEKGQVRTIRIEYHKLRWVYNFISTRAPERLQDLAESGDFDLSVTLWGYPEDPYRDTTAGPIRVRIVV